MICIDCKHCEVKGSDFRCKRLRKIVAPFRNCLDKQNIKKEKMINYYLQNYQTKSKAEIAKHFDWDRTTLNAFIANNVLPSINERTGEEN